MLTTTEYKGFQIVEVLGGVAILNNGRRIDRASSIESAKAIIDMNMAEIEAIGDSAMMKAFNLLERLFPEHRSAEIIPFPGPTEDDNV